MGLFQVLDIKLTPENSEQVGGFCGNYDGDKDNDFALAGGTIVGDASNRFRQISNSYRLNAKT